MFGFPAFGVCVALVEAHDFPGEEGGFVTAGASADLDEGVAVFVGIGREEGVLDFLAEVGEGFFEFGDFHGGHFGELWVGGSGEFLVLGELGLGGLEFLPEGEGLGEFAVFAEDFGGALGIVKEVRVADGFFEVVEAVFAFFDE